MLDKNNFFIKDLEAIIFIGFSSQFNELFLINKKLKIETSIITSTDQSKYVKEKFKIFDKFDSRFKNYINKKFDIKKTLFISLGSRIIFKKEIIDFLNGNLINFHSTRLPFDAGGGGYSWTILREDRINNQLVH